MNSKRVFYYIQRTPSEELAMADDIVDNGAESEGDFVNGISDDRPPGMPILPGAIQKHGKKPKPKPRASVLEYKTVNEM